MKACLCKVYRFVWILHARVHARAGTIPNGKYVNFSMYPIDKPDWYGIHMLGERICGVYVGALRCVPYARRIEELGHDSVVR